MQQTTVPATGVQKVNNRRNQQLHFPITTTIVNTSAMNHTHSTRNEYDVLSGRHVGCAKSSLTRTQSSGDTTSVTPVKSANVGHLKPYNGSRRDNAIHSAANGTPPSNQVLKHLVGRHAIFK